MPFDITIAEYDSSGTLIRSKGTMNMDLGKTILDFLLNVLPEFLKK